MSYKYVVITHKNCPDGFSAAWVIWTKYKNDAKYFAYNAGSNQSSVYAKMKTKMGPTIKLGKATPEIAINIALVSQMVLCLAAATTPRGIPIKKLRSKA